MKKTAVERDDKDGLFAYAHRSTEHPRFVEFKLHTHNDYEIYVFLKGDITFLVEGIKKKMSPYDIVLIRGNELHNLLPNPNFEYERVVLNISDDFFDVWNCGYIREIFSGSIASRFIPGGKDKIGGIDDDIRQIDKYIRETKDTDDTVVKCAIIEFLHDLSRISNDEEEEDENTTISEIIRYINQNLTQAFVLDELADRFFLSKYYMCRLFKKSTGFTINQYIVNKRILLVKKMCKSGMNLSLASVEAGFGSYTNFYKAYVKEFGVSPGKGLKNR